MNKYYKNYFERSQKEKANSREKNRSFGEQLFPLFICCSLGTFLIHFVSFVAAVIFPAFQIKILLGNPVAGFIIGGVFVFLFLEVPKFVSIKTVCENYFDSKGNIKSYGLSAIAFCCISISILSSTYGIELGVKWFSPDAKLVDVAAIEEKYNTSKQSEIEFYGEKIEKYSRQSVKYFNENSKFYPKEGKVRLSSAKSIKEPYNEMLASLSNSEKSLNDVIKKIEETRDQEIKEAKAKNELTANSHSEQKESSGTIAFWVMLAFELTYVAGIGFVAYYVNRSEVELIGLSDETKPSQTDNVFSINNQTVPHQPKQQTEHQAVASRQTEQNPIGFKSHGSVFIPDNGSVPKVWYQTKTGSWANYSASDLKRMISKDTGSDEWKKDLSELVDKIESYEPKK